MPLANANIRLLKHNFDQLHELGSLETILPLLDAMKVSMTAKQFDLAMTQMTMSADNRQAAYLFLVEGKTAVQMQTQHGVSASRLSKVLKRVVDNYEKQLDEHDLVSGEYLLDAATAKLVSEIEAVRVQQARISPYKAEATEQKQKTKAKKKQVKSSATPSNEKKTNKKTTDQRNDKNSKKSTK